MFKKPIVSGSSSPTSLGALTDVNVSSPVNNTVLTYDTTTAKWMAKPTPAATGLNLNQWNGKTWVVMGDSITAFTPTPYHTNVQSMLSMGTIYNNGIASTALAGTNGINAMVERIKTVPAADLITVFGGTNDYGQGAYTRPANPLGTMTAAIDQTTVYGALHSICQTLINSYPNAKYAFFTPLPRADVFTGGSGVVTLGKGANALGYTLVNLVDIILEVAAYYSIPVLDLYRLGSINPAFTPHVTAYFATDKIHPNAAGHSRISTMIADFIRTL